MRGSIKLFNIFGIAIFIYMAASNEGRYVDVKEALKKFKIGE